MKALQLIKYGDIEDSLAFNEVSKPDLQANDVLIETKAAAINPIDNYIILGNLQSMLPIPLPSRLAYDVSGTVVDKGDEVTIEKIIAKASTLHYENTALQKSTENVLKRAVEAGYSELFQRHQKKWDQSEYYLCGEQLTQLLKNEGLIFKYRQVSECAGILLYSNI